MKCLSMKVSDILLFLMNFIITYQESKPFQTTLLDELVKEFNCPQVSQIIYDNNLADYTIDCKPLNKKGVLINVETVLQHACFIVSDMLKYMCENKINITSDLLTTANSDPICPFNFSYLNQLGFSFRNEKVLFELTNADHCSTVCSDLYSSKTQCILLSKLNRYLENLSLPVNKKALVSSKVNKPLLVKSEQQSVVSSKVNKPLPVKSEQQSGANSASQEKKGESTKNGLKEITAKEKLEIDNQSPREVKINVSTVTKDAKNVEKLTITSTAKIEQKSNQFETFEGETKMTENESPLEEINEIKSKDEPNEEDQMISENAKTLLDDSFSDKTSFNQDSNRPKMENFEDKIDSSPKGKGMDSGEGFFQPEDSHFFFYFLMVCSIIVIGYLAFHNKNKILAYALEGTSGRRSRRRPNPARYRKLETNLEEAILSNATNAAASSVVY